MNGRFFFLFIVTKRDVNSPTTISRVHRMLRWHLPCSAEKAASQLLQNRIQLLALAKIKSVQRSWVSQQSRKPLLNATILEGSIYPSVTQWENFIRLHFPNPPHATIVMQFTSDPSHLLPQRCPYWCNHCILRRIFRPEQKSGSLTLLNVARVIRERARVCAKFARSDTIERRAIIDVDERVIKSSAACALSRGR